ncbi:MAG: hypothetical protein M0011_14420 [Elusimicrobia bacterium]|nr:hypothetical protein [Elusimicrobiota bacterium]
MALSRTPVMSTITATTAAAADSAKAGFSQPKDTLFFSRTARLSAGGTGSIACAFTAPETALSCPSSARQSAQPARCVSSSSLSFGVSSPSR